MAKKAMNNDFRSIHIAENQTYSSLNIYLNCFVLVAFFARTATQLVFFYRNLQSATPNSITERQLYFILDARVEHALELTVLL